jgi:hypothetical protein
MAEVRAEELWRVENRIKMLQEVANVVVFTDLLGSAR